MVGDCIYAFKFPTAKGGGDPGFVNVGVVDTGFKIKRVTETRKKKLIGKDKVTVKVEHKDVAFRWSPGCRGRSTTRTWVAWTC